MSSSELVVSLVVAVYNNSTQIQRCIDSFTNQTYQYKEIIIIDGGSQDGTLEIIQANADQIAYWESGKDKGIYHAWNKALNKVKGDWVIFLGSDDYFYNQVVLEQMVPHLVNAKDVNVVYGKLKFAEVNGKEIDELGKPWSKQRFISFGDLPHNSVFHRKILFEKNGLFDESFRIAGDYELLLRELKDHDPTFVDSVIVAVMESGGLSSNYLNGVETVNEKMKARVKNGFLALSTGLIWMYFRFSIKVILYKTIGDKITKQLIDVYRLLMGRSRKWSDN
jgi:glycosyltransferase involved in cell wall biosynthesis